MTTSDARRTVITIWSWSKAQRRADGLVGARVRLGSMQVYGHEHTREGTEQQRSGRPKATESLNHCRSGRGLLDRGPDLIWAGGVRDPRHRSTLGTMENG